MESSDERSQAGQTSAGLSSGRVVFQRFKLDRILGAGGMGVVWLARDEKLGESVALKFVPNLIRWNRRGLEQLRREARTARNLAHPNIVRVYDVFEDSEFAAIAMEYVEGHSLAENLASRVGGCFEIAEVEKWIGPLCEAVDYAHREARLVHRDIKPANLLLSHDGAVKLGDFGIAHCWAAARTGATGFGQGTSAYMSPQQLMGEPPAPSDDIYSLGASLYELLTGRPPFYVGQIAVQVIHSRPQAIAARRIALGVPGGDVPDAWNGAILSCLEKDPRLRPQSGAALAALLVGDGAHPRRAVLGWRRPRAVVAGVFGVTLAALVFRFAVPGDVGPHPLDRSNALPHAGPADFSDDFFSNFSGWLSWGEPRPQRIPHFQGRKWLLDNNGDDMFLSGLTSLRTFEIPGGFTLESEVMLSVANPAGCHCEAYLGLTRDPGRWMNALGSVGDGGDGIVTGINFAGDACWGTPMELRRHVWWGAGFFADDGRFVASHELLAKEAQLADDLANRWVKLRIEVDAERSVRFFADDRLMWAPEAKLHPDVLRGQRIVLKGRSLGTAGKAYHDWVRLRPARTSDMSRQQSAPARPMVRQLSWSSAAWERTGLKMSIEDGVGLSVRNDSTVLSAGDGVGEAVLRSVERWRGDLTVEFQVQPLLRSSVSGRDSARVGLVAIGPGRSERFVGVEFVADQLWLVDSANGEAARRVALLGGYASGSWQTLVMHVDAKGSFSVAGSFMETFPRELGDMFSGHWAVELAVRDSGDGARFRPVRIVGPE